MDARGATAVGALRWSRALVLASVALITGVMAHVTAGQPVPGTGPIAVLLVVVACAVGPLLRHPASTRRVVLLVAAGETFIHFALLSLSTGAGHPAAGPMAGMHHARTPAHTVPLAWGWLAERWWDVAHQHVSMTAAHLAAAMAVGLWLAAGERALWVLLCLTLQPITGALAVLLDAYGWLRPQVGGHVRPAPTGYGEDRRAALAARACEVVARRGPPVGSLRRLSS